MKPYLRLFLLASMLVLSGCSLSGIISPPRFNETEYRTAAEIATIIELNNKCDEGTVKELWNKTTFLEHYTKYLPNNENAYESASIIRSQLMDLMTHLHSEKGISETFCQRKLQLLLDTVEAMQHGSGGKLQ